MDPNETAEFVETLRELDARDIRNELTNEDISVAVTIELAQVETIHVSLRAADATVSVCVDDALKELAEHGFLADHVIAAYRERTS